MNTIAKIKPETATPTPAPIGNINCRMVEILRDLDAIGKNARNAAQGFNYRGIDDVYNAINPLLAKYGVFMTAEVLGKTREERVTRRESGKDSVLAFTCLHMRYTFHADDGSSVSTEAEGEGMDSGDKSSNKAMAVAHKYALLQAFCVPTKDLVDPDADSHEVAPRVDPVATVQDQDITEGVKNWCDKQKGVIQTCSRLPDLMMWLDEQGGDWVNPTKPSPIDRLKRKAPEAFEDLKRFYQAKFNFFNKGRKEPST